MLRLAHHMRFAEFASLTNAVRLRNHGRDWEIFFCGATLGFADGTLEEALRQVHEREVNNALYANTPDVPAWMRKAMPTRAALDEYPHLREQFADVPQLAFLADLPESGPCLAAREAGYVASSYAECPYVSGQKVLRYWHDGFIAKCLDAGVVPDDTQPYLRGQIAFLQGSSITDCPEGEATYGRWVSGWLVQRDRALARRVSI